MLFTRKISKNASTAFAIAFASLTLAGGSQIFAQAGNPFSAVSLAKVSTRENAEVPAPPPAPANWSGFYVGGFAGGSFARASANTSTIFSPTGYFATSSPPAINVTGTQRLKPNGVNAGIEAGYNHQAGHFVIGAEADFGVLTGSKTQTNSNLYPCCAPTNFTVAQSVKNKWLFTARPRAGFTAVKALFYVTGGLALTNVNYSAVFTDTFATASESGSISKTRLGWTAGGGIEAKIAPKWSAKAEYLFADFRRVSTTSTNLTAFAPPIAFPTNIFTHSIYLKENVVRFGINYHF